MPTACIACLSLFAYHLAISTLDAYSGISNPYIW
jgi:hypothetical protein